LCTHGEAAVGGADRVSVTKCRQRAPDM